LNNTDLHSAGSNIVYYKEKLSLLLKLLRNIYCSPWFNAVVDIHRFVSLLISELPRL